MGIYDMVPGEKYLIGDSLGYDLVICLSNDSVVVWVKTKEGQKLELFETPDCPFSTYVEPREW